MVKRLVMRYTVEDLRVDFPDDNACLEWLVNWLYPDGILCKRCKQVTKHYKVKSRRSYSCSRCGRHLHPTAGTPFHKTTTPLTKWFYAIYLTANTRAGISAKQLERELGVTYKTAWRMFHQIRRMMGDEAAQLSGEVEMDETYVHANVYKRSSARRTYGLTGARTGQIVFGMVERGGRVKVRHVLTAGARVLRPIISKEIAHGTIIYTDEHASYRGLHRQGYRHFTTNHSRKEYVNGSNYTQNIENVWSHMKRGIKGVYRHIDPKYVQNYANEYAWRYSYRHAVSMFWSLMDAVARPLSEGP